MPRLSALLRVALLLASASLAACAIQPANHLVSAPGSTRQMLFTENWRFNLNDVTNSETPAFNDSAWRQLDLPHDWCVELGFDQGGNNGHVT